jgi:ribosome-associated toxin RatA of RatAB toxin-antitoxin module
MAGANREEIFDVSAEQYYRAVTDFENYPELLPEVSSIEILEKSDTTTLVQYSVQIVKQISYTLKMTHTFPTQVEWHLDSGSLFKANNGSWTIEPLGDNQCKVTYDLDIALKVFAPKTITKKLVAVNLPRMMKTFYEHAKTL